MHHRKGKFRVIRSQTHRLLEHFDALGVSAQTTQCEVKRHRRLHRFPAESLEPCAQPIERFAGASHRHRCVEVTRGQELVFFLQTRRESVHPQGTFAVISLPQQITQLKIASRIAAPLANRVAKQLVGFIAVATVDRERLGQLQFQQRMRHWLGDQFA